MPHQNKWTNKNAYRIFLAAWIVTLALIAVANILIDPFELYGSGLAEPWQFNRYKRKLELFKEFQPPPSALLIGDSRMESFDPVLVEKITGKRCFNFALPAAAAEAILAVGEIALEESGAPVELVIVGLDPMTFHPSGFIQSQMKFVPEFARYLEVDPKLANFRERASRVLTIEQTGASMKSIGLDMGIKNMPAKIGYHANGQAFYPEREGEIETGAHNLDKILADRVPAYPEGAFGLTDFSQLSESRQSDWEEFLSICAARDIEVYVFMQPLHPSLWNLMKEKGAEGIFNETRDYVESTVESIGGKFEDFTDIGSVEGDSDGFYDEVHMTAENCDKVLSRLLFK